MIAQHRNIPIAVPELLKTYDGTAEAYFQQVDKLIKQINALNLKSSEEIQIAQKLLLNFT